MEAELALFENELFGHLDFYIKVELDRTVWETVDAPAERDFDALNGIMDQAFHTLSTRYRSEKMFDILYDTQIHLENAFWLALNVPFPRDVDRHADRCLANARVIYTQLATADILREMTFLTMRAQVIQERWRMAIANPAFDMCRKRLRRELTELRFGEPA
jgi:hypothetical protein